MFSYTILENLIPEIYDVEDKFNDSDFYIDEVQTTSVEISGVNEEATIENRWDWLNIPITSTHPDFNQHINVSNNNLYFIHPSSFPGNTFSSWAMTAPYGYLPYSGVNDYYTSVYANSEASFDNIVLSTGTASNYDSIITVFTGIYDKIETTSTAYNVAWGLHTEWDGSVSSYISYFRLEIWSNDTFPPVSTSVDYIFNKFPKEMDLNIECKNQSLSFKYKEKGRENWTIYHTIDLPNLDILYRIKSGLFTETSLSIHSAIPESIMSSYSNFKVTSYKYDDFSKLNPHYYSGVSNFYKFYYEYLNEEHELSYRQTENTTGAGSLFNISSLSYTDTPYLYESGKQGIYTKIKIEDVINREGGGIGLYVDKNNLPDPLSPGTSDNAILITAKRVTDGILLKVLKMISGNTYLIFSTYIAEDVNDYIEIAAGFDNYDTSFWIWTSLTRELVNISDPVFIGGDISLALLSNGTTYFKESYIISVQNRMISNTGNKYVNLCGDDVSVNDALELLENINDTIINEASDLENVLNNIASDFDESTSGINNILEDQGYSVDSEELSDKEFRQALFDAGVGIVGGKPVIKGDMDITGYKKLVEIIKDWSKVKEILDENRGLPFIFIITKNIYDESTFTIPRCNSNVNLDNTNTETDINNTCLPEDLLSYDDFLEREKIGEELLSINKSLNELKIPSVDLNFYIFWIGKIQDNYYTTSKLRNLGIPSSSLYNVLNAEHDENNNVYSYILPFIINNLENLWGELDDEEIVEILNDLEIGEIRDPGGDYIGFFDDVNALDLLASIKNKFIGSIKFPNLPLPDFEPQGSEYDYYFEDFEDDQNKETSDPCLKIYEIIKKINSTGSSFIEVTKSITEALNTISDKYKFVFYALEILRKTMQETASTGAPGMATALASIRTTINNTINTFFTSIGTIYEHKKSIDSTFCAFKYLNNILDQSYENYIDIENTDLNFMEGKNKVMAWVLCEESIKIEIFEILETFKLIVKNINMVLQNMQNLLFNMEVEFNSFDINFNIKLDSIDCGKLIATITPLTNKIINVYEKYNNEVIDTQSVKDNIVDTIKPDNLGINL